MVEAETNPKVSAGGHKIPLVGELPTPDERVFNNSQVAKPERKIKTLDVRFGQVTNKNFE